MNLKWNNKKTSYSQVDESISFSKFIITPIHLYNNNNNINIKIYSSDFIIIYFSFQITKQFQ